MDAFIEGKWVSHFSEIKPHVLEVVDGEPLYQVLPMEFEAKLGWNKHSYLTLRPVLSYRHNHSSKFSKLILKNAQNMAGVGFWSLSWTETTNCWMQALWPAVRSPLRGNTSTKSVTGQNGLPEWPQG